MKAIFVGSPPVQRLNSHLRHVFGEVGFELPLNWTRGRKCDFCGRARIPLMGLWFETKTSFGSMQTFELACWDNVDGRDGIAYATFPLSKWNNVHRCCTLPALNCRCWLLKMCLDIVSAASSLVGCCWREMGRSRGTFINFWLLACFPPLTWCSFQSAEINFTLKFLSYIS